MAEALAEGIGQVCVRCGCLIYSVGIEDRRQTAEPPPGTCLVLKAECPACGHVNKIRLERN